MRIAMVEIFGIAASHCVWPEFSAHAVGFDRPFLSFTGYRSFLGIHADPMPGLCPDELAREIFAAYLAREIKGRFVEIKGAAVSIT